MSIPPPPNGHDPDELPPALNADHAPRLPDDPRFMPTEPTGRLMAVLEIVFVSGFFTDTLALLLAAWLMGVSRPDVLKQPVTLFVYLMFSTVFILALVGLFQYLARHRPELSLRLFPTRSVMRHILFAVLVVPLFFLVMIGLREMFEFLLPDTVSPVNPILEMIRTPLHLGLFFISVTVAGGIREEIQRAFIIRRSDVYFGSPYIGLVGWSVVFGFMHIVQGVDAVFVTAVLGLGFGLLYIYRRNVLVPFLTHTLFNCTVLVVYWLGRSG